MSNTDQGEELPRQPDLETDIRSRNILGDNMVTRNRVEPLDAFSTPDYLQLTYTRFRRIADSIISRSTTIAGGSEIIKRRYTDNFNRMRVEGDPLHVVRSESLDAFFRTGFGMIANTLANHHPIAQAEPEDISVEAYSAWLEVPRIDRSNEMRAYLGMYGGKLLADNLIEPPDTDSPPGAIFEFATTFTFSTKRVDSPEPYVISARYDAAAREEVVEGSLAALFLIRQHHFAQTARDFDTYNLLITRPDTPPDMPYTPLH